MSVRQPIPGSTPATPPKSFMGPRLVRMLRWVGSSVLLAAGMYLSAFFAGWTFHPAADPRLADVVAGLGFAALLGLAAAAGIRLLVRRPPLSGWLLLGLLAPLVSAADAYLW